MLGAVSCAANSDGPGQGDPVVTVRTMVMEESPDVRTRTYVGQAEASQSVVLYSPYPGTLERIYVNEGDKVRKGELVAEISSEAVRSAYETAQATLRQAEDGYSRIMKVYGKGGVADIRMKEAEASLAKARAEASAARKAMQSCLVKSPFEGSVSGVYAYQGSEVTALEPLAKIVDASSAVVVFAVPERELSKVHAGMSASLDIPALDMDGIPAEVISKGVESYPVSHTYECRLKLLHPVSGLAPGMICKVSLDADAAPVCVIPAEVVHTDDKGRYVWTVRDGRAAKVRISTGGFAGGGVIASEGLSKGDRVIVEGFRKVSSGMKVKEQEI